MNAFERLQKALQAAGIPFLGVEGTGLSDLKIVYDKAATPAQKTQGASIAAALDWSEAADAKYEAQLAKQEAVNSIDYGALQRGTTSERLVRALALVVLDEVNNLRSFAGLNTYTTNQLMNAIKAKIALTGE